MKLHLFIIFTIIFTGTTVLYSQIDIFDKAKDKIEEEIKKEQKEKEKQEKLQKEKEKAEKKKAEEYSKDTVSVSLYHLTHKGSIAFCSQMDADLTKDIGFGDSFGEKDIITACVYMDKRMQSYELTGSKLNSSSRYFAKCFIDDKEFDTRFSDHLYGDVTAFSLRLQGTMGVLTNAGGFWDRIYSLSTGNHTVRIEIWGGEKNNSTPDAIAKGEFIYVKSEPEKTVLKRFSDIPAGMNSSKLEAEAIEAINRYAAANDWKERYHRAVITSYDWVIERNEWTGIIICRKLYLTMLGKWPDGSCRFTEFGVRQDHDGSRYSSVMQYNSIGGMYDAECE